MMLRLSESITPLIIQRLIIAQVTSGGGRKTEVLNTLKLRLEVAVCRSLIDAVIIAGVTFFSSMVMFGPGNIIISIKVSIFSAIMLGGLTLFTTLKTLMGKR